MYSLLQLFAEETKGQEAENLQANQQESNANSAFEPVMNPSRPMMMSSEVSNKPKTAMSVKSPERSEETPDDEEIDCDEEYSESDS